MLKPSSSTRWLVLHAAAAASMWYPIAARAWDDARVERSAHAMGAQARALLPGLRDLLARARRSVAPQALALVNDYFNQTMAYRSDLATWGRQDHWATLLELLDRQAGDCEDFAIAKYLALLAAGVPDSRLRLVYARIARDANAGWSHEMHMVTAYYPALAPADPLILDSVSAQILPASQRTDLQPVFSFNGESLGQGLQPETARPADRLSPWRALLARARAEGTYSPPARRPGT